MTSGGLTRPCFEHGRIDSLSVSINSDKAERYPMKRFDARSFGLVSKSACFAFFIFGSLSQASIATAPPISANEQIGSQCAAPGAAGEALGLGGDIDGTWDAVKLSCSGAPTNCSSGNGNGDDL